MMLPPKAHRLRSPGRLSYQTCADRVCRRRRRGSPALLAKLLTRLSQARDLYALNMWARGGIVTRAYRPLRVHRGRRWRVLTPSKWHVGLTWGALARTRRVAAFKARAANKKRKKISKGAQMVGEMRILQYRALQLGQRRRTSTKAAVGLEDQLRSMGP
jgi:hypothetical protein